MKRIFITKEIIELSNEFAKNLFSERHLEKPLDKLEKLKNELKFKKCFCHADYVEKIINNYTDIIKMKPQDFDNFHSTHFKYLEKCLGLKLLEGKLKFYELIVKAMCYKDARDEFLPYINKLGIKACVYCNAQLAVTTEIAKGHPKGFYELDHFFPQSKRPYLCTSFFNLQPVCANCNKSKSNSKVEFHLYTNKSNDNTINPFQFQISKKSLIKYMLNQNNDELEIIFDSTSTDNDLKKDYDNCFHITALYGTQKDLAEEIVWKSQIYNESYQKILKKSFPQLFNQSDFNRFIIGNYDKTEDIHKRPMAKFVQDIAKQLNLI
jgi:hypothetical protein